MEVLPPQAPATFATDLRLNSGKTGQMRSPVRATHLASVETIVIQSLIAVDLAEFDRQGLFRQGGQGHRRVKLMSGATCLGTQL